MRGCPIPAAAPRFPARSDRCGQRWSRSSLHRLDCREDEGYRRASDKVPYAGDGLVFEFLAVPHARFAAEIVDCRFVAIMLMGLAPCAGRDGRNSQVDPARTHRLSGHAGRTVVSCKLTSSRKNSAGWPVVGVDVHRLHVGHLLRLLVVGRSARVGALTVQIGARAAPVMYIRAVLTSD